MGGGFSIPQFVGGVVDGATSGLVHFGETVASIVTDFLLNHHHGNERGHPNVSLLPPTPVVAVVSPFPTGNNEGPFKGLETTPSNEEDEESIIQYPLGLMSSLATVGNDGFISPAPQAWVVPSSGSKRTRDDGEDDDDRDVESTTDSTKILMDLPTPKRSGSKETRFVLVDTPIVVRKKETTTADDSDSSSKLFQLGGIDRPLTLGSKSSATSTAETSGTSNSNSNSTLASLDFGSTVSGDNLFSTGTSKAKAAIHDDARPQTLGRGRKNGRNKSKKGKNKNGWHRNRK